MMQSVASFLLCVVSSCARLYVGASVFQRVVRQGLAGVFVLLSYMIVPPSSLLFSLPCFIISCFYFSFSFPHFSLVPYTSVTWLSSSTFISLPSSLPLSL